jgi:hypothetical protein
MDCHPTESDAVSYLVEREGKLASSYSAVLVDRQHAGQKESLRWDVLPTRVPEGTLHAKLSLLVWADAARLIVGSGNLTTSGYRQNLEVFGAVDFTRAERSRVDLAAQALDFFENCLEYTPRSRDGQGPAARVSQEISRVRAHIGSWPASESSADVSLALGTRTRSVIDQLVERKPTGGQTRTLWVVAPFYERDGRSDEVVAALGRLVSQRGEREISLDVPAEPQPGGELIVRMSKKMFDGLERAGASVNLHRVLSMQRGEKADEGEARPLHAKMFLLQNEPAATLMIGSSNCTAAGLGLGRARNFEANLVYQVKQTSSEYRSIQSTWPATTEDAIVIDDRIRWEPQFEEGSDQAGSVLPIAFEEALFNASQPKELILQLGKGLPTTWSIATEDGMPVVDSQQILEAGEHRLLWGDRPAPVVLDVIWQSDGRFCAAAWPVNVLNPDALPPPEALQGLSLEELVEVLGSTRPLHEAVSKLLKKRSGNARTADIELDPHRRINTEEFLLRRTRRVALALDRLRERLERPALGEQAFCWRLEGPVGVVALADAFVKEARSSGESAFFLAELVLMLQRVRPEMIARGGMQEQDVRAHIARVISLVTSRVTTVLERDVPPAMSHYAREAVGGGIR